MNKKGFTLTELLSVISLLAIISLIAIPNIVNLVEGVKNDNMVNDAKKLVTLARTEVNSNYAYRNFLDTSKCSSSLNRCTFNFDYLNRNGDIEKDPDGEAYQNSSYVRYYKDGDIYGYCVYLKGSKRAIGTSTECIIEPDLMADNVQELTCIWSTSSSRYVTTSSCRNIQMNSPDPPSNPEDGYSYSTCDPNSTDYSLCVYIVSSTGRRINSNKFFKSYESATSSCQNWCNNTAKPQYGDGTCKIETGYRKVTGHHYTCS